MSRPRARTGSPRDVRLLLSTAPAAAAARIARTLVTARVAACVNVVPRVASVFRWRGKVERTSESLLLVKTTARALPACVRALRAAHPYEVPEALVVTPSGGLTEFARWVSENVSPPRS